MADQSSERRLRTEVSHALARALGIGEEDVQIEGSPGEIDLVLRAAGVVFAVEVLGTSSPGVLASHATGIAAAARRHGRKTLPLVAVPFMTDAGRRACEAASVSWFDLSGNARIVAPGLRIIIDGRPNRFRSRGRPASIFAPKSSRVARWLLIHHGEALTQREIARATDMTDGFVSRIVSRLESENYVIREPSGAIRVKNPDLLLDAWRGEYRFDKHTVTKGHVAARSGDALTRLVSDTFLAASIEHAATGLAAAWQMTRFAGFRIATFFVAEPPSTSARETLGFREDERGANLWLVTPNDAGVFHAAAVHDGVRCVHPVQAYLDLQSQPERATEAAERLRAQLLMW